LGGFTAFIFSIVFNFLSNIVFIFLVNVVLCLQVIGFVLVCDLLCGLLCGVFCPFVELANINVGIIYYNYIMINSNNIITNDHINFMSSESLDNVSTDIVSNNLASNILLSDNISIDISDDILVESNLYTYIDVDTSLADAYNSNVNSNYSTICDIIAVYLKGQKILYTEAKTVCEQRLTCLMLPAIFLTVLCSILSLILQQIQYGNVIVSGLGGITTFILALINYLKLDAKAESYRISAYKFDKLQSYVEFSSGKLLFIEYSFDEFKTVITKTEEAVSEIKASNQFVLPEIVRFTYPNLYGLNVFSEVKKIQYKEMICTNNIKYFTNQITIIKNENIVLTREQKHIISAIEQNIHNLTNDFINMKHEYLLLDRIFDTEIKAAREYTMKHYHLYNCDCFKV